MALEPDEFMCVMVQGREPLKEDKMTLDPKWYHP